MNIKILGSGCPNCHTLENRTKKAVAELGLNDVEIEHITEVNEKIEYGVMATPALVIDGEVRSAGRLPETEEIKSWLNN